ncbi:MAG: hypothetical protein HY655_02925, partial [Acidobacteria bacterium]|nr:hypothetical protein [Acidobacteriota bacterium]
MTRGLAMNTIGRLGAAALVAGAAMLLTGPHVSADQIPTGGEAHNMKAIGYSGLDGRGGAFKMAIKEVNGKWYL